MNSDKSTGSGSDAAGVSAAQLRMWFLQNLRPADRAYNVTEAIWLRGRVDADAMERALLALVRRHNQLRAVFSYREDTLRQRILPAEGFPLRLHRETVAESDLDEWLVEETSRGFDLERGPLCRAALLDVGDDCSLLVFSAHHIVTDGWSSRLLFTELRTAYRAAFDGTEPVWQSTPLDYREAVESERMRLDAPAAAERLDAAAARLDGAPFALDLPVDGMGGDGPSPAGTVRMPLPTSLVDRVDARSREFDATSFMFYAAAYAVLLARYAGKREVLIGLPTSGRENPEVADTYGLFVNTVPLRVQIDPGDRWADLITKVRAAALEAYRFAEVPFDQLVARLGQTPTQAMLVVQPDSVALPDLPGIDAAWWFVDNHHTKFDVVLHLDNVYGMLPGNTAPEHGWFASLEFPADRMTRARAERMLTHWLQILSALDEQPDGTVADFELGTPAERALRAKHRLLEQTTAPLDPVAAFHRNATERPEAVAVWVGDRSVDYGTLASRVDALRAALRDAGVRSGDLVGVCLRRTENLVATLLAILGSGAAYVPLDSSYPAERLAFITQDAQCALTLVEPATLDALPAGVAPILDVTTVPTGAEPPPVVPVVAEQAAYLIYTSGSTGKPKGVVIPHRALRAFLGWARQSFQRDDLRVVLASTSVCFDLSVFELFLPLSVGTGLRLVDSAMDLAQSEGEQPTLINSVPSVLAEVLRARPLPSTTRVVNLAGEALPRTLVDLIHEQSATARVYNLYGPSEDTTYSTWVEVPRGDATEPTIGSPILGTNAYVLDQQLLPVPVGVDGELFLGGHGIAQGYQDRQELTAERFVPDPFAGVPGTRMYRTGDRVRLTESGQLRYLGRYDHQVKLRGFRIETGEIESRAAVVRGVTQVLVVLAEVGGVPSLVCYWTGDAEAEALRAALSAELPGYMVPRFWVRLPAFPLNSNGKIDRNALPAADRETGGQTEPETATEQEIAAVFAELTGSARLGADADFFALGGHSLLAMQVVAAVRDRLDVEIVLADVFEHRSVRALAAHTDRELRRNTGPAPLRRRDSDGPVPLGYGQQRMWLVEQVRPGSAMLNIGSAMRIEGELDRAALRVALQELNDRHEALRLRINQRADGQVVQLPLDNQSVPLYEKACADADATARALREAVATPIDLETEPPARWVLLSEPSTADGRPCSLLVLIIHHVIADGWSLRVLWDDLRALYTAARDHRPVTDPPGLSVLDHAEWQRRTVNRSGATRRDTSYWQDRLAAAPERLQLPFDHSPAEAVSFSGDRLFTRLPDEAVETLLAKGNCDGATPFITLLTMYQALLGRLSGQDDVIVGTPIANREQSGTETLVGCLLNTLALRADLGGDPSFDVLLAQTRQRCLEAFAHQQTPFELVVSELAVDRRPEHTPVFQSMFVFDGLHDVRLTLPDLDCAPVDVPPVATQYDLTLMVGRDDDGWHAAWDYRTDLLLADTVERIASCFNSLLREAAARPERALRALPLCQQESAPTAGTATGQLPVPDTLPALFATQVAATPDAEAVRDDEGSLSYRELDAAAEQLARRMVARGVGIEDRVALLLPRSRASVVAMVATAKAGAAFVHIDPDLPAERMSWIVRDSAVRMQLTDAGFADRANPDASDVLLVDEVAGDTVQTPLPSPATDNLAYVIYTSGSTGKPKGVLLSHRGLAQLRKLHHERFHVGPGSHVLQYAPYSFDASVWEFVMGLLSGACIHVTESSRLLPGSPLASTLDERGITHLTMPPSNLAMLDTLPESLRHVVLAGEELPAELVQRWRDKVWMWNAYGPTEATVCATIQDCAGIAEGSAPNIGTEFAGARARVLDTALNLLPPGIAGELFLGGQGIARGYLDRPEQTAEKFVPDPYSDEPGARLYRTGDLARLTESGEIEFLGRIDEQVKVRGIRIELGEIESTLAGLESHIDDTAVLVTGTGDKQRLVGFVASTEGVDTERLREKLAALLPGYMVPVWLERLDSFPLNGNGKLDRKALAARAADRKVSKATTSAPRGRLEEEVASIWRNLLPQNEIGREDSFFTVGGTSLTLTRLHERLDARFPGALKLVDLFRLTTVAAIARALESAGMAEPTAAADFSFRL